jgi:hypothetical protein
MNILNVLKELNTIMPQPPKTVDPDIAANNRLGSIIGKNKTCEFCGRNDRPLDYAHLTDATGEYFDPSSTERSRKGSAFRHLTHVSDLDNRAHACRGKENCHGKIAIAAKEGKPLTVDELQHRQDEHRNELKNYYDKYLYRRFKPVMGLIDKLLVEEKAKPVPNMKKIRSLIRDRKKHRRTLNDIKQGLQGTKYITRTGKVAMMIKSFITKQAYEGKYKPQNEARARINNKLAPHAMSNRKQEVNPAPPPPMGFGAKTVDAEHIVDNYVPQDRTHAFKYRGRTYDASKMTPEEIADILAEMEQQIK